MQTLAISTPTLSTIAVAADSPAGVASLVGTTGAGASFANLLQGQTLGIADPAAATSARIQPPGVPLDLATISQPGVVETAIGILPLEASTGKILPVSGKEMALVIEAEDEPMDTTRLVVNNLAGLGVAMPKIVEPEDSSPGGDTASEIIVGGQETVVSAVDAISLGFVTAAPQPEAIARAPQVALPSVDMPAASLAASVAPPLAAPASSLAPNSIAAENKDAGSGTPSQAPDKAVPIALAPAAPAATVGAAAVPGPASPTSAPISISIAAVPAAAAVPSEQSIKALATDVRASPQAVAVSAGGQLATRPALPNAASGDASRRGAREDAPARTSMVEPAAPTSRASAFEAFATAPLASAVGVDRVTTAPAAAALPTFAAAAPDRAEAIASVVDRLMAAREVGLGSLASIAVANREFGDLTVSFSDMGSTLEVSVTAADSDKQRALAAALTTAERPVARDAAPQTAQSPSGTPSNAMQQDRHAEGQLAREHNGRQPRGEAVTDQRRAGQSAAAATETETAAPQRGGIYV